MARQIVDRVGFVDETVADLMLRYFGDGPESGDEELRKILEDVFIEAGDTIFTQKRPFYRAPVEGTETALDLGQLWTLSHPTEFHGDLPDHLTAVKWAMCFEDLIAAGLRFTAANTRRVVVIWRPAETTGDPRITIWQQESLQVFSVEVNPAAPRLVRFTEAAWRYHTSPDRPKWTLQCPAFRSMWDHLREP